jgi:chemotaxis protein CheX
MSEHPEIAGEPDGLLESLDLGAPLPLPESLDLVAAAPLRDELLRRRGAPLDLDGSAVERFGGQCLQVLLAAQAAWQEDGQPFRLVAPSEALTDGLRALGALPGLAGCTEEIPA